MKSAHAEPHSKGIGRAGKSALCFAAAAIGLGLAAALAGVTGGMAAVPILAATGIALFAGGSVYGAFAMATKDTDASTNRPLTSNDLIGATGIHYVEPHTDDENR